MKSKANLMSNDFDFVSGAFSEDAIQPIEKKRRGRPPGSKNKNKIEQAYKETTEQFSEALEKLEDNTATTETELEAELEVTKQCLTAAEERRKITFVPKKNSNDIYPLWTVVEFPVGDAIWNCFYLGYSECEKGKHCLKTLDGNMLIFTAKDCFKKKANQDFKNMKLEEKVDVSKSN